MNRLEATEMLIEYGADLSLVTSDNGCLTALHLAAFHGYSEMVSFLLRQAITSGIDINAVDLNSRTALDYCAYYGRTSCLEALLAVRADPSLNDCKSLSYAVCRGHEASARLLLDKGGNLIVKAFEEKVLCDDNMFSVQLNRRAILIAAQNGFPESYQSLIRAVDKAVVEAERPFWRGIARVKITTSAGAVDSGSSSGSGGGSGSSSGVLGMKRAYDDSIV